MSTWEDAVNREFVPKLLEIVKDPEKYKNDALQLIFDTYGTEGEL